MIGQAVYLDNHGNTSYAEALDLPLSYLRAYFESPVYQQQQKVTEANQKMEIAVIGRLDVLIKAFGGLAKAVVGRR